MLTCDICASPFTSGRYSRGGAVTCNSCHDRLLFATTAPIAVLTPIATSTAPTPEEN